MEPNFDKLTNLLTSIPMVDPKPELHQKIMSRVQELDKLATLGTTLGDVYIQRKKSELKELAFAGAALFAGDKLITNGNGKTFIMFNDGTQIWLNQNTTLELSPKSNNIFIPIGELLAFVTKRSRNQTPFTVGTPGGLVEVLGTEFNAMVSKEKTTVLTVLRGLVNFKNPLGETKLKKNLQSVANPTMKPTRPIPVIASQKLEWATDLVDRSRQEHRVIPKRFESKSGTKEEEKLNTWLVLLLLVLGAVFGYILGYWYGLHKLF
ncbi:MAG: FecR domain-containing protein [bacterium]